MKRAFCFALVLVMAGLVSVRASDSAKSRDSYLKKAQSDVDATAAKLKSLEERSEKSGTHLRKEFDQELKSLDGKLAEARHKLDLVRTANESTWKSVRRTMDETMRDLERDYHHALSAFDKNEK